MVTLGYSEILDLCYHPYPNYSDGCPNFLKYQKVNVPYIEEILDNAHFIEYYLLYLIFDFIKYKELRMIEN